MSETKFTKGEWVVNSDDGYSGYTVFRNDTGFGICQTILREDKDLINANLIAAAPEMYEEIESEIEFLRELRSEAHTPYMVALLDNRIVDKVNLLAKARGEK